MSMKYLLKKVGFFAMALLITICMFSANTFMVFASETDTKDDTTNDTLVYAKLINLETGEITNLDVDKVTIKLTQPYSMTSNKELSEISGKNEKISKTYTVEVAIPNSSTEVSTQDSSGGSKNESFITATATIYYTRSGDDIRVTSTSGRWSTSNSSIYMSEREVWLYSGVPFGSYLEKYPTTNTFNYYTGWGYMQYYPGSNISGTRVFTSAVGRISGMTASYRIELLVTA